MNTNTQGSQDKGSNEQPKGLCVKDHKNTIDENQTFCRNQNKSKFV